ncbi:MAG: hypothetical protein GWP47_12065 [Actinobacteria bacterium]|nr:hypothetical protein [Actinomycetota bacterium]NCG37521.1 hypothetical protein [Actinomycetota bacterium]
MTIVTFVPENEWADELARLHGNKTSQKLWRYVRPLTLIVLTAAIVVVVLFLA